MIVGNVAVNFIPMVVTFNDEIAEIAGQDAHLSLERSMLAYRLFGEFDYDEEIE